MTTRDDFDDLPRDGNLEYEVQFLLCRISWASQGRYWRTMTPCIHRGVRLGLASRRALEALERYQRAADLPEPREDLRKWFLLNA